MILSSCRRTVMLVVLASLALLVHADAPGIWRIDAGESSILFEAEQAGARFEGRFETWTAEVRFDPDDLENSSADVRIETASVATRNRDRDATLNSADFFATDSFPEARYHAESFVPIDGGRFRATGTLTIRDVSREVPFAFSVEPQGDGWLLEGITIIQRLAFDLGASEDWRDTDWIGDDVTIRVRVLADGVD